MSSSGVKEILDSQTSVPIVLAYGFVRALQKRDPQFLATLLEELNELHNAIPPESESAQLLTEFQQVLSRDLLLR
jgi:hypothetical protein